MSLFVDRLRKEAPELDERGVRLRIIGRRDRVHPRVREQIDWAEELTAHNAQRTLFVAFDYGGRAEILDAAEADGGGGEEEFRLSNVLLWEAAYSELYFSDKMWPDFDREEFERAVSSYGAREYRFGGR